MLKRLLKFLKSAFTAETTVHTVHTSGPITDEEAAELEAIFRTMDEEFAKIDAILSRLGDKK